MDCVALRKSAAGTHREGDRRGRRPTKSAPENRGAALHRISKPGRLGRLFVLDGRVAVADRDRAGLLRLGNLAHEVDVQEAVLKLGALDLDEVGELESALESSSGNALIEYVAALLFLLGVLLAADGQSVLLGHDRELVLGEAGYRDGDTILVVAGPLDVVGRVPRRGAVEALIEHREQPVKADGRTIEGCEIESSHGISSF